MTKKVAVEVGIDRETDELVVASEFEDMGVEEQRRPMREVVSATDEVFVHVDDNWRIHIVPQDAKAIISDPIPEELRYE